MVRKKKEEKKYVFVTGKRKTAVARAKLEPGKGKIFINSVPIEIWGNELLRLWVKEPLYLAPEVASKVNIYVSTRGGGIVSQAEAVRQAIAKGLVEFTKDKKLREKFLAYDRNLLVYDPRRNEPHKAKGASKRGARKHRQRSKR